MPYQLSYSRRRYQARRKYTPRRKYYRKPSLGRSKFFQASLARAIANSRSVEKKYAKYTWINNPQYIDADAVTSQTLMSINDVPQGGGVQARIGDSLYLRSVRVNLTLATDTAKGFARVIIFQWNMNDYNPPIGSDILDNWGTLTLTDRVLSILHKGNIAKGVLTPLVDETVCLDPSANPCIVRNYYIKTGFKTRSVTFDDGVMTGDHKIWMMVLSNIDPVVPVAQKFVSSMMAAITFTDS